MSDDLIKGKGFDKFKDIGFDFNKDSLSHTKFVPPGENIWKQIQENDKRSIGLINASQRKKQEYDQEVLQILKNIERNTSTLSEVVPLLSLNIEKQEEILDYLKEAFSISASESKQEAESKWRSLMTKATEITTDVETVQKLHGFANTIYSMFQNLPGI